MPLGPSAPRRGLYSPVVHRTPSVGRRYARGLSGVERTSARVCVPPPEHSEGRQGPVKIAVTCTFLKKGFTNLTEFPTTEKRPRRRRCRQRPIGVAGCSCLSDKPPPHTRTRRRRILAMRGSFSSICRIAAKHTDACILQRSPARFGWFAIATPSRLDFSSPLRRCFR